MKKLVYVAIALFVVFYLKDRVAKAGKAASDPVGAGLCTNERSYVQSCLEPELTIDFKDRGYIYLIGKLKNRGDKRLADVKLRIKGKGTRGDTSSFTYSLGAFSPGQTRTFDEMLQSVVGISSKSSSGQTVATNYSYEFEITVESVRFAS